MKLTSRSFKDGGRIPGEFAFCVIDAKTHARQSANRNPHLAWSDAPAGTKSFALICCDPDVPSRGDDVDQEDREVPAALARVDFFHWLLWDIPASVHEISAGSHSDGITARGKHGPDAPQGWRHGSNDYTGWFAGDADMGGTYYGYDGPCPPWNDSVVHRYAFTVYALDAAKLEVAGDLTGANLRRTLAGHILAEASLSGSYTLNPRLVDK